MSKYQFEIIFNTEFDKKEFLEFIELHYNDFMSNKKLELKVNYEMTNLTKGPLGFTTESIKDIILIVTNITAVLIPIVLTYLNSKGKKRIKIIDKKMGKMIDISNLSGKEASEVLISYYKTKSEINEDK